MFQRPSPSKVSKVKSWRVVAKDIFGEWFQHDGGMDTISVYISVWNGTTILFDNSTLHQTIMTAIMNVLLPLKLLVKQYLKLYFHHWYVLL